MATDTSLDPSLDDLIAEVKRSEKEANAAYLEFRASQRESWEELAGSVVAQMLQSRQMTEPFVSDPEPKRRLVALGVLLHHWKPDATLAAIAERLAFEDPDPEVRAAALSALAACYSGTDDRRIGSLLAGIVRDGSQSSKLRKAAYFGLLSVCDVPMQSWPDVVSFRFPEEVDWNLVGSVCAR